MDAAIREVEVDGLRLRYLDAGPATGSDTAPTLLVIPGHTARLEGYDEMVPILAERHRVLIVDLPGCGGSDKPDRPYTLRFYEDTLMAVLDRLGIDQAIPVGGSLGGALVLRLGHRFPVRFPRLVVWAPGGAWKARPGVARFVRRLGGRLLFWPTVRIQSRYWYSRDFPGRQAALASTFAYYREVMSPGFVRMYWDIATDQMAHTLFDMAPSIRQPTLLLWGDQDHGAGMGKGVARLHELLPDNRLHVFPGARHSLEAERPAELARLAVDFAAADGPAAPGPSDPS